MNEVDFERGGSLSHLGLEVESTAEVLAIGNRWRENGLTTLDEMKTDCCYALQDKIWVATRTAIAGRFSRFWKIRWAKKMRLRVVAARPAKRLVYLVKKV
ncbi:MAG TPA: hypothetical protein VIL74_12365 [Pyrinomonadaceae bacterium]|jgi:hypothetical protein